MTYLTTSDNQPVVLERFRRLHLVKNTPKGRGIFAGRNIPAGTVIDTCPALILDPTENVEHIEKTSLYHYTYNWPIVDASGKPTKTQAVVLGLGSMFNHSTHDQNVGWKRDLENRLVVYRALRDIQEGEELCISYGGHLTFIDADESDDHGVDNEAEDDHLSRIQLSSLA